MGMVFGKYSVETPKYEVMHTCSDYEIRKYSPSVVAQVTYTTSGDKDKDSGFMILAKYIGAFGTPQNAKPEPISMTVPVITSNSPQKIAMTVPVITEEEKNKNSITMQFVLPSKYQKAEDAPKPTDDRVVIREEGERKYGVVKFSGIATEKVVEEKVVQLKKCLERDGHKVVGDHVLARYNPPWITLPPFRTNEVMLPVE